MNCFEETLVVIPYFNFYPKEGRLAFLKDSLESLTRVCDVWLVHCGESFPFKIPATHTQLNSESALKCFQKEALINHAIERLRLKDHPMPLKRKYERVLFIDADMKPWGKGTWSGFIRHLSTYKPDTYGQPCSHILTHAGLLETSTYRILMNPKKDLTYGLVRGTAPGGCWVVGWDALCLYAQYPYSFVGGGDSIYLATLLDDLDYESFYANRMMPDIEESIYSYINTLRGIRSQSPCRLATPSQKMCMWSRPHGQEKTKKYVERHDLYNISGIMSGVKWIPGELVKCYDNDSAMLLKSFISGYMENL